MIAQRTPVSESVDFTAAMDPTLAEHYKTALPFLRSAVDSVLPERSNHEWLTKLIGKPLFEWDHDAITEAVLVPIRSYLHRTGKLFRPYLVSLCLEAYGFQREQYKEIIGLAEVIHSASLMADDIADDSEIRRGQLTAHRKYGLAIAGISSLSMFNISSQVLGDPKFGLPDDALWRVQDELAWEHFITGLGTGIDLGWSIDRSTTVDLDAYFDHLLGRSCSYTYRMPIKIGALVARAPESDYLALVEFGQLTGLAFQLIDDILNVAPRHSGWGKKVGEDITAGKRSLLVLSTLTRANEQDRRRLLEILDSKTERESDITEAVHLMEKYDAFRDSWKRASVFIDQVLPRIDQLSIAPGYKTIFQAFARYVVDRWI